MRLPLITLAESFRRRALILSRPITLLVLSCLSWPRTNSSVIGLKTNFGKSVDLAGGDGKVMKDFSFIASFVPIVEK